MQKKTFRRIAKFRFKNKSYQMFRSTNGKIAYLEYKDNKYYYPSYNDLLELVSFFSKEGVNKAYFDDGENTQRTFCFIPKVQYKASLLFITSAIVSTLLTGCTSDRYHENQLQNTSVSYSEYLDSFLELDISYNDDEIELNNTNCYETEDFDVMKLSKYVQLYNNKYFTDLFGVEKYTFEEIDSFIVSNNRIKFIQDVVSEFANTMYSSYPGLEFRVFAYNVKTLNLDYQRSEEIEFDSSSVAYYDVENNTIVISENIDLNNPKDLLVLRHELGHLFNNLRMEKDGWKIKYSFNDTSYGKYPREGLDVLFTTLPYYDEYNFDNLGYPITTNMMKVLVSSLPNYKIEDSISSNVYYLEKKLDEYKRDDIPASVILDLINLQWLEYSSNEIEVDLEDYKDLYKYITELYIKSNVTSEMSCSEIMEQKEILIGILTTGLKYEGLVLIDTQTIEDTFMQYIEENSIVASLSR